MENNSTKQGREGERIAKAFLEQKGYSVLESNWRFKHLELDLIALHSKTLVFVEVKFRKNDDYGEPELFVNPKKQKHLIRAANEYMRQNYSDLEARFDIVSITGHMNQITHLEGAFFPTI
ncbi:MAG TPA: YraN family protein [Bacteroidia bacterium]|nr:YraN family protein [Bacteroidia bacterium]